MIAAIAFACTGADPMTVQRVKLTPQLKACLALFRFAAVGHEPVDCDPIDADFACAYGVEQHLELVYTSTVCVDFSSLACKRYLAPGGVMTVAVNLRWVGIGLCELARPLDPARAVLGRDEAQLASRALHPLADAGGDAAPGHEVEPNARCWASLGLLQDADELFGHRWAVRTNCILKIVSHHKFRAVLLMEPARGDDCCVRLYADEGGGDESEMRLVPHGRTYREDRFG